MCLLIILDRQGNLLWTRRPSPLLATSGTSGTSSAGDHWSFAALLARLGRWWLHWRVFFARPDYINEADDEPGSDGDDYDEVPQPTFVDFKFFQTCEPDLTLKQPF